MAANTASLSSPTTARPGQGSLGLLGLPEEIKKEICNHCSQCDLICLSLVCRNFHELAAAKLYRNFHIVFPDEDDPSFDSPIDGLAGGLDTFVTSEYNYAKHLRDLSLDTLSSGDKAETAYKPYLFSVSCGKFMNTLLLLTLRKAKSLDTFRWNIRVELNRSVYKALHDIKSLRNLHVRMQSGPSLYDTPPSLPYYTNPTINSTGPPGPLQWQSAGGGAILFHEPVFQPAPLPSVSVFPPGTILTYAPPPAFAPPSASYKPSLKSKAFKKPASTIKEPPTIGGFKNLQSLCVLDIESLDVIGEIQTCVRNSSSTLKKLKLSFSDNLAIQARRPHVEDIHSNESDDDDEFDVAPMNNYDDGNGPAKVFRAQQERKLQESILGEIFEIEPFAAARKPLLTKSDKKKDISQVSPSGDPEARKKQFLTAIQTVSKRLSHATELSWDLPQQEELLGIIAEASRLYISDREMEDMHLLTDPRFNAPPEVEESGPAPSSPAAGADPDSNGVLEGHEASGLHEQDLTGPTLFATHEVKPKEDDDGANPEDIDVAAPEDQLNIESQEEPNHESTPRPALSPASTSVPTPTATSSTNGTPSKVSSGASSIAHKVNFEAVQLDRISDEANELLKQIQDHPAHDESVELLIKQTGEQLESLNVDIKDIQHEMNVVEAEIEDATDEHVLGDPSDKDQLKQQVSEYARRSRGIALKSLSIHLIPVKASVLGRAIDLRTLTRITLINVGNQAPLWTLMTKENKLQPLPLCKIFTDNVSPPFLQLVSQLEKVEELFLLERSPKFKPESFAPKTKVTLEQIRRAMLKKHMPTIKRLIIKNQVDGSWDMDEKTIQLICKRGKALEELAVAMGIRAVHAFLQYLSSLIRLRALHIISFRNDDTCLSVMRETRRFIVDTVSHYPELQLEWISMGDEDRAERIIRKTDIPKKLKKKKKSKAKGKEVATPVNLLDLTDPFPILPTHEWGAESSSEDEDDEGPQPYLKLDLMEGIAFYDIWGVRIFKKEIMAARL
ncbi:F-box domain-containing protein [Xylariales sp. AK1849]|nr:F-box domain-containing protein [Xylariales sp. AK1849]